MKIPRRDCTETDPSGSVQPTITRLVPDPATCSVEMEGKHYLSLLQLIQLKLASGLSAPDRLQDFADVISLIRVNALAETFADSLHPEVQPKFRELWGYAQRPTGEF